MSSASVAAPAAVPPAAREWYRVPRIVLALVPLAAVHLALFAIPFIEFSAWYLVLVLVLTRTAGLGITIGFHRYLSHHSFKTSRAFQFFLAVLGCTALQKGPLWWVIHHRLHHQHADREHDPHSPVVDGFWYGHCGWLFARDNNHPEYRVVRDLKKFPELVWLDRLWMLPGFAVAATCFAIGGWGWLVYGYCLSTVLVFQVAFAVNSIGHLYGSRRFETSDGSRNNFLLGFISFGDGWHNNHHRAPTSARHGFAWYEFDQSYMTIKLLARLGLVWDVKLPSEAIMNGSATATEKPSARVASEVATVASS